MENNQSFWQFSDQLRLQTSNLANLSLNDSIWSNSYVSKRRDERINFDIKVGGEINSFKSKEHASDYNDNLNGSFLAMTYNNNNNNNILGVGLDSGVGLNGGFNKGIYSKPSFANLNTNINLNINPKGHKGKLEDDLLHLPKSSKKNNNPNKKHDSNNSGTNNNDNGKDSKAAADKRFKTLPPSESLPRNETIGGYIFVCNNDTMAENLKRQLFGMFCFFFSLVSRLCRFYAVCDVTYFTFFFLLTWSCTGIESLN